MIDNVSYPSMQDRVEIDTSLPFQSVKAAVSMFGEKVDMKKSRMVEKHGAKEAEVHKLKEDLAILKLQLAEAEKDKVKAFAELRDTKKLLEEGCRDLCVSNQSQTCATFATDGMQQDSPNIDWLKQNNLIITDALEQDKRRSKQSNPNAEEKHVVWEVQLKVAQEQHMNAVAELESAKKELEKLKKELMDSLREKENALRQAEEALMSAELNARRVEELSHEISGTNESLVLVKLACIEASKERAVLLAAKSGASPQHQSMAEHEIGAIQELEIQLAVATQELIRLRQELALAKEAEVKVATAASEAYANLAHTKSELEKTRLQASSTSGSTSTLSSELKMMKRELEKALENGVLLQATMDALQSELELLRKELADLTSREANASAAVVTLTAELSKTKAELASAIAAENKANEALLGLTQTLQQIKVEADEAHLNANILKDEASKARADAEHAKNAMASAQREVEVAIKAAEAAKAAESEALEKFKALAEKTSVVRETGVEGGEDIPVSHDEYEQLKKKLHEAEELADMRVAAANAEVEAVKMGELELEQKLKILNDDLDMMKNNTQQVLQRAEMAESAKLAVESEMRRWREKGHQTKKVDFFEQREVVDASTQKDKMASNKSQLVPYSYVQPTESLAQVLNMKMPPLENDARSLSDRALGHRKKKHYLPGLNIFSSKKNLVET